MSEVTRYFAGNIDKDREVYLADDFDRVTAERDAALALHGDPAGSFDKHMQYMQQNIELQQRLTAADERADVLEGLLRGALRHVPHYGKSDWQGSLRHQINEALKPAEGSGNA